MATCWQRNDDHPGVIAYDLVVIDGFPRIDIGLEPSALVEETSHFAQNLTTDVRTALYGDLHRLTRTDDDLMWWRFPVTSHDSAVLVMRCLRAIHTLGEYFARHHAELPPRAWTQGLTILPALYDGEGLVRATFGGMISRHVREVTATSNRIDWQAPIKTLHDIVNIVTGANIRYAPEANDNRSAPPLPPLIHWSEVDVIVPSIEIGINADAGAAPSFERPNDNTTDMGCNNIDTAPRLIVAVAAFAWLHGELRRLRLLTASPAPG